MARLNEIVSERISFIELNEQTAWMRTDVKRLLALFSVDGISVGQIEFASTLYPHARAYLDPG